MTQDEFEECLIAWGRLYGSERLFNEERSLTGNSTLSRIGGKPKQEADRARYGQGRRKMMGQRAGLRGLLPDWAVAPVSGTETRSFRQRVEDRDETPALTRLQAAWLALWRESEEQAQAVRLHYQERRLTREDKARKLGMTVRAYREAVNVAKAQIYWRVAA